ncbi:hypothetical protein ACWEOR_05690 [Micromonospora chalcea]
MGIEERAREHLRIKKSIEARAESDSSTALAALEPDLREFAAFMLAHNVPTNPIHANPRVVKRGLFRREEVRFDYAGSGWRIRIIGEGSSQYIVTTDARLFSFQIAGRGAVIPKPVTQLQPPKVQDLRRALVDTASSVLERKYDNWW